MKKVYNENPKVSSALSSLELHQNPRPLIIGERLNSQGSKKAKKMVLDNDFDGLIELARFQVEDGAHCLDVCVATTERSDEQDFMQKIVKRLSLEIEAPLVIDSTDSKVIATALKQIPGVPIINSINLEGDGNRFNEITPLMKKYGAPAISMCIGPNGMAKTGKEKLEVAGILYDKAFGLGLKPWQLIFDVLTFTLATGEEEYIASASHTLDGIKFVKEKYPKSLTTLGLSNVSFGLSPLARKYLNSVFLYHAIKSGLDTVIINPKDIIPYPQINSKEKRICEDLIFNNNSNALSELISYFSSNDVVSGTGSTGNQKQNNLMEIDASWDAGKKCYFRIVNRLKDGIENDVVLSISEKMPSKGDFTLSDKLLENRTNRKTLSGNKEKLHDAAVQTLNEVLLPAMKEVGDKFGAGELILPFVLKSAECMKAAVVELEKYLIKQEGISKGKIVLCTVYGDVHDIGKNLVKTILVNNGYEVFDLGKQVPIPSIVKKIKEVKADAVGLSALLVSTSKQMQLFSEFMRENKMDIPVLCGGAAINSDYISRIAKGDGNIYKAGIFYCKTAFEGLKVMNNLMSGNKEEYMNKWLEKLTSWKERKYNEVTSSQDLSNIVSSVKPVKEKPVPPEFNFATRLENKNLPFEEIWQYLNKKSLFVLSWGLRGKKATELKDEYEELLKEWKVKVVKEKLFDPHAVYSYFRCRKVRNNSLCVKYQIDNKIDSEIVFEFPRSSNPSHLCLADYFDSESDDVVAFQSVTMGNRVTQIIEEWNKQGRYTDAYYLHGLAVETTEALADWINYKIKEELRLKVGGLRYSWGYPSCPDITQHFLVWKLLNPSISGMTLTESGQIDPEFSTAAIVVHNPAAQYFTL
ncbi:dihydropteroate synthase [Candidatus Nitrosocosmicus arcticus]|uniref:Putative methionine synthase n=1 Tax=Candidatus Nitrosocosmicus arcticus TaxID=2035267 RepID=A0A557SYB5_9ARCH|nr:dihydropteroate synthase [Candidatus Nitrosocosmicus arcticus]TVP41599.1 putative methionine synthase [Candidatus Nitrosocosmicus arcticus]